MAVSAADKLEMLKNLEDASWANLQNETRRRQYDVVDQHLQHILLVAQVRAIVIREEGGEDNG